MASKLDKAQASYEKLLRELGNRANMIGMFEQADPGLLEASERAKEAVGDRKLELELIDAELNRLVEDERRRREDLEQEIAEIKDAARTYSKSADVKKTKLAPLKKALAGGEYDFKFAERALDEEMRKQRKAEEVEDFEKASKHEDNVKRMKIDILKRKKKLAELRRQIEELENPAQSLKGSASEAEARVKELQKQLAALAKAGEDEVIADLKRQRIEKERDVQRAEQHLLDTVADIGEDLYERRVRHSVLDKYYADLDEVARVIDELQGEE